ncbi:hypothetical protein BC835DRAFT_210679 [Cytidiella melzeri]|nr:hypothetical protein BC835DRAFT_210679 [Cytidiella melzeri]
MLLFSRNCSLTLSVLGALQVTVACQLLSVNGGLGRYRLAQGHILKLKGPWICENGEYGGDCMRTSWGIILTKQAIGINHGIDSRVRSVPCCLIATPTALHLVLFDVLALTRTDSQFDCI